MNTPCRRADSMSESPKEMEEDGGTAVDDTCLDGEDSEDEPMSKDSTPAASGFGDYGAGGDAGGGYTTPQDGAMRSNEFIGSEKAGCMGRGEIVGNRGGEGTMKDRIALPSEKVPPPIPASTHGINTSSEEKLLNFKPQYEVIRAARARQQSGMVLGGGWPLRAGGAKGRKKTRVSMWVVIAGNFWQKITTTRKMGATSQQALNKRDWAVWLAPPP
jgi:hypothetical protein